MNHFKPVNLPASSVITLVLLFTIGQALAVVNVQSMDYKELSTSQLTHNTTSNMKIHAEMGHTNANNMDCCQVEVSCQQCPQAVCAAVSMLFIKSQPPSHLVMKPVAEWTFYDGFYLNKNQSPLYRPPII